MGELFSALADVFGTDVTYSSAARFAALLAFCALGETVAERAGTLNISTEAMILAGAFAAAVGSISPSTSPSGCCSPWSPGC